MSRAKKKRSPGTSKKNRKVLEQINHHAAGADMGSEEVVVCVGEGVDDEPIRTFGTTTAQLRKAGEWMLSCGIDTVAIEATGVYWVPAYEIWQEQGLEPVLVESNSIHSLNGKKKSDFIDAHWLQLLHTFGLLRPCQRAERSMIELRGYMRRRREVIEASSACIQHMHAALTLMNVRLDQAVSDITGLTGMRIIRAILKGERDPFMLAQMRDERCFKTEQQIAEALTGHYRDEQVFVLEQAVQAWDFHQEQLRGCDQQIENVLGRLPLKANRSSLPKARRNTGKARKNEPRINDGRTLLYERLGVDLTLIDGIQLITILTVISECGIDLSRFPTYKHFCSWLGLCAGTRRSGKRVLSSRSRRTTNRAATALRLAAQSLHRSQTALGAFYRRMKARLGPEKATTATANKLAKLIYLSLTTGSVYVDPGPDYFEQANQSKALKQLRRRASKLGYQLTPIAA
jgi:transposase